MKNWSWWFFLGCIAVGLLGATMAFQAGRGVELMHLNGQCEEESHGFRMKRLELESLESKEVQLARAAEAREDAFRKERKVRPPQLEGSNA